MQTLNPAIGEPIYGNLVGLYKFIFRSLVEGNLQEDPAKVEDGLRILLQVRETWRQAIAAYRKGIGPGAPAAAKPPAPSGVSLSLQA